MPVLPPPPRRTFRFVVAAACALSLGVSTLLPRQTLAQTPVKAVSPAAEPPADHDEPEQEPAELPDPDVLQQWIEALGSDEFAARERAATRLLEVGTAVLPILRKAAAETDDPEIRLRSQQLAKQLTRGDLEARIESFLAGNDVPFEGWRDAQAHLGDSTGARELFIQMMRTHPDLAASLEGTPRDLAMAMETVTSKVHLGMTVQRRLPTAADAVAMLLPANDPDVPINSAFENVLMAVLHYEQANRIRRDVALSGPFKGLVGGWVQRSTLANRQDVLFLAMDWELDTALPLARQTLNETNSTDTLSVALQAIARFGGKHDAPLVLPLLDDTRPASERGFTPGRSSRTQLGDVAMATIALLYDVPLSDVGFENADEHPRFGFILSEIGFPFDDQKKRKAAREKIDELLKPTPPAEES